MSEVTDDVYAESVADEDADLRDYNRLIQQTQKKLHIVGKCRGEALPSPTTGKKWNHRWLTIIAFIDDDQRDQVSILSTGAAAASEQSDEFIRNFFIKFGMRKTLEAF